MNARRNDDMYCMLLRDYVKLTQQAINQKQPGGESQILQLQQKTKQVE